MRDKYGVGADPYCYPGSEVLRNRHGITDDVALQVMERRFSTLAADTIEFDLPPYDLPYLQRIHRTLFADLYDWAGELRSVDIAKPPTRFCTAPRIEPEANRLFRTLAAANWFEGMTREQLIPVVADFYGEVNMIHPFREGNGRAQRILFEHIVINVGFEISWWQVEEAEWIAANIAAAVAFDAGPLVRIFERCVGAQIV